MWRCSTRKVDLVNFDTDERIKANSISEFCRLAKLLGSDKYHITPILDGERIHHKNWCLPSLLEIKAIFVDLHYNEYTLVDLLKLRRKYQLTLSSLVKLINGDIDIYKGLHIKGTNPKFRVPQHFEYEFSNGENTLKTSNIAALSRKLRKPSPHNFYKVIYGGTSSAYGYKVTKINLLKPTKNIL